MIFEVSKAHAGCILSVSVTGKVNFRHFNEKENYQKLTIICTYFIIYFMNIVYTLYILL